MAQALRETTPSDRATEIERTSAPVLLYDGRCGLCNRTVKTVLRYDRKTTLRFASLRSEFARGVVRRHPELADQDTVVWFEPATASKPERVFVRSTAALRLASYLGGFWRFFLIAWLIPRPVRDLFYRVIARFRYRVFGQVEACTLGTPEVRRRFVDFEEPA